MNCFSIQMGNSSVTAENKCPDEAWIEDYLESSGFWKDEAQVLFQAAEQFRITREVQQHVDGEYSSKHELVQNVNLRAKSERRKKLKKLTKVLDSIDEYLSYDIENDFNDYLIKRDIPQLEFGSLIFRLNESVRQMIPKLRNPEGKPADIAYKAAFDILCTYLEKNNRPIPFKAPRQSKKVGATATEKEKSFQFLRNGLQQASGNKGDLTSKVENLLLNRKPKK